MKRATLLVFMTLLVVSLVAGEACARGGRGGGGGGRGGGGGGRVSGGGGGYRGGGARTPSMSRPAPRPNYNRPTPRPATRPAARPTARPSSRPNTLPSNRPNISRPNVSRPNASRPNVGRPNVSRPGTGNRPTTLPGHQRPSSNDLKNFLDLPGTSRPSTLPGRVPATRPGNRPTTLPGKLPNTLPSNRPGKLPNNKRPNLGDRKLPRSGDININAGNKINAGNRMKINQRNANKIRNNWNHVGNRPFNNNWFNTRHHGFNNPHWHWHAGWGRYPNHWCWRHSTWGTCSRWFLWGAVWTTPYRYSYGSDVVYVDNSVYVNDEQVATSEEYYQQADAIAENVPEVDGEKVEWMPLGVFAITVEGGTDSGMVIQLAVSKEGIIAGTFYNNITDSDRPLEGTVDQKTQRAAWKFADGKNPEIVMETVVYNLTEDEATALVHYGSDKTQTWLLVRLDEQSDDDSDNNADETTVE